MQTQVTEQSEAVAHPYSSHPSLTVHSSETPKTKEEHLGNIKVLRDVGLETQPTHLHGMDLFRVHHGQLWQVHLTQTD